MIKFKLPCPVSRQLSASAPWKQSILRETSPDTLPAT